MKFAKGLLTDDEPKPDDKISVPEPVSVVSTSSPKTENVPVYVEKDRLFQTVEESKGSARKYLTVLGVVAVIIAVGGAVAWYLNRPGTGDRVRVSSETEMAVRDHFLLKEKRTATDIAFFQCDGFYWARVGVEIRTDMPNPLLKIPVFKARVTQKGDTVSNVAPISSPADDQPCS